MHLNLRQRNAGRIVNSENSWLAADLGRFQTQTVELSERLYNDESLLRLDDEPRKQDCRVSGGGCMDTRTGSVSLSTQGETTQDGNKLKLLANHPAYNVFHLEMNQLSQVNGNVGTTTRVDIECAPTKSVVINILGTSARVILRPLVYRSETCERGQVLVNLYNQGNSEPESPCPGDCRSERLRGTNSNYLLIFPRDAGDYKIEITMATTSSSAR
ncbi:hypothetical protein NDN08_002125 [Rhodosorus marinus]|uniref:Uncharacterized protein n=1 Tax=Rhodosorus marinus TaxID=101924 RepID=A0AAV8UU97_9RHOD|nr:hypothetical protein NDN08_002125 [Rhodosorus marinus]